MASSTGAADPGNAGSKTAQASRLDWKALRREFPATERYAYLDLARKATLPRCVESAARAWFRDVYENAGADAFAMENIEETRQALADLFGAPAGNIAFIKNTSEGINIVAQGFPFQEGDNVVISEFEHENNTFPWRHLAARGVELRLAKPDPEGRVTVDCYRPLVDGRTRMLAVGWVVYGNGYRADIPGLAAFCHERGVKLVVDGIQGVGILATPLTDLGADVIVAGGHKAQFSLAGAGFLYATDEMIETITPPYAAKFSFASNDRTLAAPELADDAHRFEYGNPNFLGIWVQRESAAFIAGIGLANIERRVRSLTTDLIERADARGLKVRTPLPWDERAGIVSFDLGFDASATVEAIRERDIVTSVKDGHLRVSVHLYNNEDDLERFLDAVQAVGNRSR